MSGDKKKWTNDNYINIGTFIFGLIAALFMGYVAMVSKDVRNEVSNDFQIKQLEEVNARMFNYNERLRDGLKEMRAILKEQRELIMELDEKNLSKEQFRDFKQDNNQRWNEINEDIKYLRSLKRMTVPNEPAYNPKQKLK